MQGLLWKGVDVIFRSGGRPGGGANDVDPQGRLRCVLGGFERFCASSGGPRRQDRVDRQGGGLVVTNLDQNVPNLTGCLRFCLIPQICGHGPGESSLVALGASSGRRRLLGRCNYLNGLEVIRDLDWIVVLGRRK